MRRHDPHRKPGRGKVYVQIQSGNSFAVRNGCAGASLGERRLCQQADIDRVHNIGGDPIMRAVKYFVLAVFIGMSAPIVTSRQAAADLYGRCMSMGIAWGLENYWLDLGPGIIVRAARNACARYLPRA